MAGGMHEDVVVLATVDPDVLTATTHDSDWVDMADFSEALVVVMAGTLGSSATFDAAVRQATDSSGTGAKAITGKAITQLTQAGTDQSDTQAVIRVRGDDLDVANGFRYISVRLTVGTASSDGGAVILGRHARYNPGSDYDLASVAEIVV